MSGTGNDINDAIEIIPDRLYWCSLRTPPRSTSTAYFFSIDNELVYEPFFADFGPLNLGQTYRYCQFLEAKLKDVSLKSKRIYHYCSQDGHKKANAAYLMGAFQVILLGRTADESFRPFTNVYPPFIPFRDATFGVCTYQCTVLDCLRGLARGISLGWFDYRTFDIDTYEFYERVENGDMNWIIPGKFLAFSGPSSTTHDPDGWRTFTPEDYVPIFKKLGVTMVVRLNKKQYDRKRFTDHGIKHVDLYFLDGSCPSEAIISKFLSLTEAEPGAVAVHCKAGLGRTGSLIACYAMKHFRFPATEFTGWIRICRPGSILGPQQHFLPEVEHRVSRLGGPMPKSEYDALVNGLTGMGLDEDRPRGSTMPTSPLSSPTGSRLVTSTSTSTAARASAAVSSPTHSTSIAPSQLPASIAMNSQMAAIASGGDKGQGQRLVQAKRSVTVGKSPSSSPSISPVSSPTASPKISSMGSPSSPSMGSSYYTSSSYDSPPASPTRVSSLSAGKIASPASPSSPSSVKRTTSTSATSSSPSSPSFSLKSMTRGLFGSNR